jgi:hypothetical protein
MVSTAQVGRTGDNAHKILIGKSEGRNHSAQEYEYGFLRHRAGGCRSDSRVSVQSPLAALELVE